MTNRKNFIRCFIAAVCLSGMANCLIAQETMPQPTEQHQLLQREVGTWKTITKSWMGSEGVLEKPEVSSGTETNRMLGGFWLVSNFQGKFSGMDFAGHGTIGFDAKSGKYIGSWIDSWTPTPMHMMGTYDKESDTITYQTESVGMDGQPAKGKMIVKYKSDGHRTMTMFMPMPGSDELVKVMEIEYQKSK